MVNLFNMSNSQIHTHTHTDDLMGTDAVVLDITYQLISEYVNDRSHEL